MLYRIIKKLILAGPDKGKEKNYPSFSHHRKVSFEELVKEISSRHGISTGDLYRIVYALRSAMLAHLAMGEIVEVKDIGSFRLSVTANGWHGNRNFHRRDIRDVKVSFLPAKAMKVNADRITFREAR